MNKSVVIIGSIEKNIQNEFQKDKTDLNTILEITSKILEEEVTGKDVERFGKFEAGKNRPIKVTFQT